jgi:predicted amidophosphoribosyltransferase
VCATCTKARSALGQLAPVIPISLYRRPSPLRELLSYYKPGRSVTIPLYSSFLSEILSTFMIYQESALRHYVDEWTDIVVVPSTKRRNCNALHAVALTASLRTTSHVLSPSVMSKAGRLFTPALYEVSNITPRGRRYLLLEDAYVSGAHSQSAAAALRANGSEVAGILALGRRVNPEFNVRATAFWDAYVSRTFHYDASYTWLAEKSYVDD